MTENESRTPAEILNEVLTNLKSKDDEQIVKAFAELKHIHYSSEAIRRQLERLSLDSANSKVRDEAIEVLNLASNRAVQKSFSRLNRGVRFTILNEIKTWVNDGLLTKENADVIQSRYDFDFAQTPQAAPEPVAVQQKVSQLEKVAMPEKPAEPAKPAPTLLQTLTSEASIKVYLYLGAFFVIAAAAILGVAVPELRLPILIIGTLIFGGLAVGIKKRLPQPSFALFIVFSFLLPITANSVEQTLREFFNYESSITSIYWAVILFLLTVVWGFGTKLYDSRLFSITAYGSFILGLINITNALNTEPEIYTLMGSLATFSGLAGVWLIKKWKDANFALPVFLLSQLTQFVVLIVSISIFSVKLFDPINTPLWHLIPFFVWALACVFIILSDKQYPFPLYPWLAAGTLIPLPWFIAAAFDIKSLGSTIILFIWGVVLSILSEVLHKSEALRKFSLPILIASMPAFVFSLITGFTDDIWLGMIVALGTAILFTALHVMRTRWWLWTLALVNFMIAYFAFFQLEFVQTLNVNIGYQILIIGLLYLLPDLFLKKDWSDKLEHRLPLRMFGVILSVFAIISFVTENESGNAAIGFAILTIFVTIYSIAYQKFWLAYLPAVFLPITILYAIDTFNITETWLPIFTGLTFLYFLFGVAIRSKENWSMVLRNSALTLGSIVAVTALIESNQANGWYVFAIGLLFIAEMVLRKNGTFEIGAPIFFSISAFLIMQDFELNKISTQLLVHSLVWILADLLTQLTFKHPRPLRMIVRGIGGFISIINFGFLFDETNAIAATGFGIYSLLFLTVSLFYRQPNLFYAFTLTLPIFVSFLFRLVDFTKWIHPVIMTAFVYYVIGFVLRALQRLKGWDLTLVYSGLGLGIFVSIASPILGGIDASIPVAVAATLWAVEAFLKRNAWLAFPANGLYLLAYFILLSELNVEEPQFFSIGTAVLGLLQHYLLVRAGSKTGAFIMGMLSQFVLLGTTYIQMLNEGELIYFFILFLQSLVVLVYGIVTRSRSLTFFPIGFVVLGVLTVVLGQLQGLGTILLIGCAGVLLLVLGILAVLLRERIAKLGEKLSDWEA